MSFDLEAIKAHLWQWDLRDDPMSSEVAADYHAMLDEIERLQKDIIWIEGIDKSRIAAIQRSSKAEASLSLAMDVVEVARESVEFMIGDRMRDKLSQALAAMEEPGDG